MMEAMPSLMRLSGQRLGGPNQLTENKINAKSMSIIKACCVVQTNIGLVSALRGTISMTYKKEKFANEFIRTAKNLLLHRECRRD